jgi:hypothetical protein
VVILTAVTTLVANLPSTASAGTAVSLTVSATDGAGNIAGNYSGTITLSSSAGGLTPTSVLLVNGSATVPVTFTVAGPQIVTASASGLTSATAPVTVGVGPLHQYLVTAIGSATAGAGGGKVTAGNPFLVELQAADAFGNLITSYSGPASVTVTTNPPSAASTFPSTVSIGTNGLGLTLGTLDTTGTYTITAADSSGTVTGHSTPLTVTAGPAAKLAFGTQPVNTPSGTPLPPVAVDIEDTFGNLVTTGPDAIDIISLSVATGPGSFTSASTTTMAAVGGVATFSNLTLTTPGNYMLNAAVSSPTLATFEVSNKFAITPAAVTPTQLLVTAPPTATAGTPLSISITATDNNGITAAGYSGTITLSSSAGGLTPTSVPLVNGAATLPITLTVAGAQTLTAASTGTPLTPGMASLMVGPGALAQYLTSIQTSVAGGPASVAAGHAFLIEVRAADQYGNPITSGYAGPASVGVNALGTSGVAFSQTTPIGSTGVGLTLGTLTAVGTYAISASGGSFGTAIPPSVTVVPAAAAKLAFLSQPTNTSTGVTLGTVTVAIEDPYGNTVTSDSTDAVILSVASGPGSFLTGSATTVPAVNGVATFNNLTLVAPGTYTLGVLVPHAYTGPDSAAFTVAPLQVVPGSFASTPSGFSLSFNAPFLVNGTTPVLYGTGFGATAPVLSVTLTGPSGPVEGSLVLDPAANSITFVETNTASRVNNGTPILPDGTYTVVVHGTAAGNGFQARYSGGGFLDGTDSGTPGNDYTNTFAVNAAAAKDDVVWVPATADGPLQTLQAPGNNQVGGGYPIYLDDSTGQVSSVNVTFNYDPRLLSITGAVSNSNLPGSSFTLNTALSSPGHAVLTYADSGANAANLRGGGVALGYLTASVPNSSTAQPIYRAKDLLHLSGIAINGGSIPSVGGDAIHLVAFVADADGNGSYSSNDAVLITRVALQTDSGFAAYPLVDPVIVADSNGDGFISANAALQAGDASVGFPTLTLANPPIPPGANVTPISNTMDPTVHALAGTIVSAPPARALGGSLATTVVRPIRIEAARALPRSSTVSLVSWVNPSRTQAAAAEQGIPTAPTFAPTDPFDPLTTFNWEVSAESLDTQDLVQGQRRLRGDWTWHPSTVAIQSAMDRLFAELAGPMSIAAGRWAYLFNS